MKSITKRSLSVILVLMTVISIFSIVPITANAADDRWLVNTDSFTTSGKLSFVKDTGGTELAGQFWCDVNNSGSKLASICINPDKHGPSGNKKWTREYSATDNKNTDNRKMLRKILYYGFNGPGTDMEFTYNDPNDGFKEKTKKVSDFINAFYKYNKDLNGYSVYYVRWLTLAWWYKNGATYHARHGNDGWEKNVSNENTWIGISTPGYKDQHIKKHYKAILGHLKILDELPEAPPVDIWKSSGGYGQSCIVYRFYVRVLVPKNSTYAEAEPSQSDERYYTRADGITYTAKETSEDWTGTIKINDPDNGYSKTRWGAYGKSDPRATVVLPDSASNWKCNGKDAGVLLNNTGVITVQENAMDSNHNTKANKYYAKNGTTYACRYFCKDSRGYGILMPDEMVKQKDTLTASDMQWTEDTPYIRLQIAKTRTADSPAPIKNAVYALATSRDANFAASSNKIYIDEDGYGKWSSNTDGPNGTSTTNPADDATPYARKPAGGDATGTKWYVKEIASPKSYKIDPNVYEFVNSGKVDSIGMPIFRLAKNGAVASSEEVPQMKLQLGKISEDETVTKNNPCYSLKDATFAIYYKDNPNDSYHSADTTITTDKDGYGCITDANDTGTNNDANETYPYANKKSGKTLDMIDGREYYAKETSSPKGFIKYSNTYFKFVYSGKNDSNGIPIYRASNNYAYDIDGDEYKDEINTDWQDYEGGITNALAGDPIGIAIKKTGSNTNLPTAGAIFKISYYAIEATNNDELVVQNWTPGQANVSHKQDIENANKSVSRIWYIETKENADGDYTAKLDENHLAQGYQSGSFYRDAENKIYIPLGIITIEELVAPRGFEKTETIKYININTTPRSDINITENDLTNPEALEEYKDLLSMDIANSSRFGYAGIIKLDEVNNRVAGATYKLYTTEANARSNTNPIATLTSTTDPKGDIFVTNSNQPKQLDINTTYYAKETAVPTQGHYTLDPTIHEITITMENTASEEDDLTTAQIKEIMATATSHEIDNPRGNIQIKKTSNEQLIPINNNQYILQQDTGTYESFLQEGPLKEMYFAIYKVNGENDNPFTGKVANRRAETIIKTDKNGIAKFDGLPVYKIDSNNNKVKQKYLIKELGYKVNFPSGKNVKEFQQLPYKWSIKKENCLQTNGMYFEGLTNDVFTITPIENHPEWNQAVKTKYYYGNPEEARKNEKGVIVELNENNDTKEVSFHNTVPETDLKTTKTSFNTKSQSIAYRIISDLDDKEYVDCSLASVQYPDGRYPDKKYNMVSPSEDSTMYEVHGLPACITYANSAICIPIIYRIEEYGDCVQTSMTGHTLSRLSYAYAEPIYDGIKEADIDYKVDGATENPTLRYKITNTPKDYTINIEKTAFDVTAPHNDLSQWFEITGVLTDISLKCDQNGNIIDPTLQKIVDRTELPSDEYYEACYEEMLEERYVGEDEENGAWVETDLDTALPALGYAKGGHAIRKITIQTDNNGNAVSHLFDENGNVINNAKVHIWAEVEYVNLGGNTILGIMANDHAAMPNYITKERAKTIGGTRGVRLVDLCDSTDPLSYVRNNENDTRIYDFRMANADAETISTLKPLNGFIPHALDSVMSEWPGNDPANWMMALRITELGKQTGPNTYQISEQYRKPDTQYITPFQAKTMDVDFKNEPITGTVTLHKANDQAEPLKNAIWVLLDRNSTTTKPVILTADGNDYKYVGVADTEDIYKTETITEEITLDDGTTQTVTTERDTLIELYTALTDGNGTLVIKDLPYGNYTLREVKPPEGYLPYGKDIEFKIVKNEETNNGVDLTYDVTDAANIMPNTGGHGPIAATAIAVMLAIPTAILAIMYHKKKKQRKLKG